MPYSHQRISLFLLVSLSLLISTGVACAKQNTSHSKPFFHAVDEKLDKQKPLSMAELNQLKVLATDKDIFVRAHAVTSLSWSRDKQGKAFAVRVAQSRLNDSEGLVRHAALNGLRRLHSPFAYDAAQKMTNDPSDKVRESAQKILQERATKAK